MDEYELAQMDDWEDAHDERMVCVACGGEYGLPGRLPDMADEGVCGADCREALRVHGRAVPVPEVVAPIPAAATRRLAARRPSSGRGRPS